MTFLPALISLFRSSSDAAEAGLAWAAPLDGVVRRLRWLPLVLFGALAAVGIFLLPRLPFDANPLHTKDATTEAMRTLEDLRESPFANPFTADIMAADAANCGKPFAATARFATGLRSLIDQQLCSDGSANKARVD